MGIALIAIEVFFALIRHEKTLSYARFLFGTQAHMLPVLLAAASVLVIGAGIIGIDWHTRLKGLLQ